MGNYVLVRVLSTRGRASRCKGVRRLILDAPRPRKGKLCLRPRVMPPRARSTIMRETRSNRERGSKTASTSKQPHATTQGNRKLPSVFSACLTCPGLSSCLRDEREVRSSAARLHHDSAALVRTQDQRRSNCELRAVVSRLTFMLIWSVFHVTKTPCISGPTARLGRV